MGISVQELKHAARLQEWSARVAECRSSGIGVKAWCAEQGIAVKTYYNWEKQIVKAATQQYALPAPAQTGLFMRVNPDALPNGDVADVGSGITSPSTTVKASSRCLPGAVRRPSPAL